MVEKDSTYRTIFTGVPKGVLPDSIQTYSAGPEGRYLYIIGEKYDRKDDGVLLQKTALWIYDIISLKMNLYDLNCNEYDGAVADFYSLDACRFVLLTFLPDISILSQHYLLLDKLKRKTISLFYRNWKISQIRDIRVGLGGIKFGYIIVSGYTSEGEGNALQARMLPADPRSTTQKPIDLDIPIARLESHIKEVSIDIYIWPKSILLLTERGIYFPLARAVDFVLVFETSLIGAIEILPNGEFDVKLLPIDNSHANIPPERRLCINYASMLVQKGRTCWLTFIVPAEATHWQWILQRVTLNLCRFILRYFGRFLLWLSRYDGGRAAVWFVRSYMWTVGNTMIPNVGPNPYFDIYTLDTDMWCLQRKHFNAKCGWLKKFGQAMLDVANDGEAFLSEVPYTCTEFRISSFPPPFEPQSLKKASIYRCIEMHPALRCSRVMREEWGIMDFTNM